MPAGWTPAETRSTDLEIRTPGTVVEDVRFTDSASILVYADDVTIRRVEMLGGVITNQYGDAPVNCGHDMLIENVTFKQQPGQFVRPTLQSSARAPTPPEASRSTERGGTAAVGLWPGHPRELLHQDPRRRRGHRRVRRGPLGWGPGRCRRWCHRAQQHDHLRDVVRHVAVVRRQPGNTGPTRWTGCSSAAAATRSGRW